MTEWQPITNMSIEVPVEELEVTIKNYKTVKQISAIYKIYNHVGKLMYIGQIEVLKGGYI